jgi:hypothetical protein
VRNASGQAALLPELAAELARLKVDVIVAYQTPPATAAKQATSEIPVVIAAVGDPVRTGLVASMARPGGNVTGTTAGAIEVAGKSVELIRELLPSAQRVAVLANETDPFTKPYVAEIDRIAHKIGMEMEPVHGGAGGATGSGLCGHDRERRGRGHHSGQSRAQGSHRPRDETSAAFAREPIDLASIRWPDVVLCGF